MSPLIVAVWRSHIPFPFHGHPCNDRLILIKSCEISSAMDTVHRTRSLTVLHACYFRLRMLQYNVFRLHAMYKTDSLILQVGQVGNGEGWTPIQEGLDGGGGGVQMSVVS